MQAVLVFALARKEGSAAALHKTLQASHLNLDREFEVLRNRLYSLTLNLANVFCQFFSSWLDLLGLGSKVIK